VKRYKVTGCIDVAVTTIVEVEDGEELIEEEICYKQGCLGWMFPIL